MNNSSLLKEILSSISIYPRKAVFFGSLILLLVVGWIINNQYGIAAQIFGENSSGSYLSSQQYVVKIFTNSKVTINDRKARGLLKPTPDYDEFLWKVVDDPDNMIGAIQVYLSLPPEISVSEVTIKNYATRAGGYNYNVVDQNTILYQANYLGPESTYTVVVRFKKGMIHFPFWVSETSWFNSIPIKLWVIISLLIPLVAMLIVIMMVLMRWRDRKIKAPTEMINFPPQGLSPALVGVLYKGMVGPREITATLLALASRDFIQIYSRHNDYIGNFEGLKDFEVVLLSKIFYPEKYKSTKSDIQFRVGHHIFSKKIAEVYLKLYEEATKLGYFNENPGKVHLKYKFFGIALFFLAILGFLTGVLFAPDPKFVLFGWTGTILAGLMIVYLSRLMPVRTEKGKLAMVEWLKFRNFLTASSPIYYNPMIPNIFEKYLPYAVVLGCEVGWTKRFTQYPFAPPEWFGSIENIITLENFVNNLFPIIGYIGQILATARAPTAE
jgi:hypothetical protein